MKRICPCFTPFRIALAEGARETGSLRGTLSTFLGFFFQTRDCTAFTLQDFYIESVTAHHIKRNDHSCFHNSWPNSKMKTSLRARGPPGVSGALCSLCILHIDREERLWVQPAPGPRKPQLRPREQ